MFTAILSILLSDVLPIFIIAGVGYLLERNRSGTVKVISSLSFNVLSPCLIFVQLVTSSISQTEAGKMAAFCVLLIAVMGIAAAASAIPLKLERKTRTSFLLSVMFSNSGNYALPLILFAFGREALAFASVYFVTSAVVVYTAGVFIAAHDGRGVRNALSHLARVPAIYALVAAGLVKLAGINVPLAVLRPASMFSDAAIPIMILVLGAQLRRASFPKRPAAVIAAVALTLLVAPFVGMALTRMLGMTGIARDAAIVVSAMPAAVVTTVLALEFDLDSTLVTSIVFVSTLLSPATLVLLIAYLKR